MSGRLPPLAWLRSFEAAARHLSFTVAAEELGVTQSAISQQIRGLEQHLKVTLFLRKPRGLGLSEAGRNLLPQVEEGLRLLGEALAPYRSGRDRRRLSLTCNSALATCWLARHLPDFSSRHPDLALSVTTALWPDEYLIAPSDVEIRFLADKTGDPALEFLSHEALFPACAPARAAALEDPARLWREATLIHSQGLSRGWSDWAAARGLSGPPGRAGLYLVSFVLGYELACQGNGVALASRLLAGGLLAEGRLADLSSGRDLPLSEAYYLRLSDPNNSQAQAFRAWLLERLAPLPQQERRG
ncbi:MAG: transcriptional regulator GcvA [Rhodospirillales bacterium]